MDEVNWGNPLVRTYLLNTLDDPQGPFACVDDKARALLKQFVHRRNGRTGEITPGCARLAYELTFRERSVRYGLGRLDTGLSRQRNGELVDGHGLIWRRRRWRPYGGQTSNAYGFTCRFYVMAGLVLPHAPESCPACRGERQEPRTAPARPRRGRAPRPVAATLPLPNMQPEPPAAAVTDPRYETFVAVFAVERFAKYGTHDGGTVRVDKRAVIAGYVLELEAEACAWAQGRGLEPDRAVVREELCRRIVRIWFTWSGTDNYLVTRPEPHPIGLIVGDLQRLGPEALAAWKRAQPRPKPARLPLPPQGEEEEETWAEPDASEPTAEGEETWAELDASEPTAEELAAIRGELGMQNDAPPEEDPTSASTAALMEPEERVALVSTGDARFDLAVEQTRASSPATFDQWFGGIQFDGLVDGVLSLRARNDFTLQWVRQSFLPMLTDRLREQTGRRIEVTWTVTPGLSSPLVCEVGVSSRRRGEVRTRLALRERPLGVGPVPVEEPTAETSGPTAEMSSAAKEGRPRRRHLRNRSSLLYELAVPRVGAGPPLDEPDESDP